MKNNHLRQVYSERKTPLVIISLAVFTVYSCQHEKLLGVVQVQVQVHLFTLIQLRYNNNKEQKKDEIKNRANYTLNQT